MFSEDKVTEIFCLADEFCKFFDAQQEKSMLEAPQDGKRHRRKPNRMSDAEIIVILIHFHSGGFRCFKHYYLHYIWHLFPRTVSYNRFVELEKEALLREYPLTPLSAFLTKGRANLIRGTKPRGIIKSKTRKTFRTFLVFGAPDRTRTYTPRSTRS